MFFDQRKKNVATTNNNNNQRHSVIELACSFVDIILFFHENLMDFSEIKIMTLKPADRLVFEILCVIRLSNAHTFL